MAGRTPSASLARRARRLGGMIDFQRAAVVAILVALVGAEVVRPTTFAAKRIAYRSSGAASVVALDRIELDGLPPIVQPALGNIDVATVIEHGRSRPFAQSESVPRGAVINLVGWCADPIARSRGALLLAIVDGKQRIDETPDYSVIRPDVARALNSNDALWTGYRIDVATTNLSLGRHQVEVAVMRSSDRTIAVFPEPIAFSVTRSR